MSAPPVRTVSSKMMSHPSLPILFLISVIMDGWRGGVMEKRVPPVDAWKWTFSLQFQTVCSPLRLHSLEQ
ncbi:MAG: hypothetical protein LBG06_12935 [Deltaproteobacteria bacterium]|nr:hypothetical protein [Deltaproteobacteria bacterium]